MALTKEQLEGMSLEEVNVFNATQIAGGDAITGADLTPEPSLNWNKPQPQPTEPIKDLSSDITPPPPDKTETQADDLTKRLMEINESLAGKGTFTREKETEFGVPESQQAVDDLSARLRGLERREQAIPIQIQQEFEGRGATVGGVAPIQAGRLRENAIEALTVSSLIDAAQNRLTSATRKVDRAVAEKFGPLIEEQDTKLKNLELILKSPAYSQAIKNRAEKQKAIEEAKKQELEDKKAEQKEIWDLGTEAVKNGLRDTTIMEKARNAKTKEEALQILAPYLEKPEGGDIGEYQNAIRLGLIPKGTSFLEYVRQKGAAGRVGEPIGGVVSDVTGKPLTEGERLSRGFAERAVVSSSIIDKIGAQFTGVRSLAGQFLPNILKSTERQQFEQAQRDFVNAVLRRESGAAIAESEFQNARKQYFPQPGDKSTTLIQKANNRRVVMRMLQLAGGKMQEPISGTTQTGLKYTITK